MTHRHFQRILNYVDTESIRRQKFKVAVDCCNGVGAVHSIPFLRDSLGCEVFPIFDEPDGLFRRDPEPTPKNLERLKQTVIQHDCAIGFAQDPDGDRLALVDEKGHALVEDLTLALAVQQVLTRHGKGPVAINLSTSKSVEYVAQQHDCPVTRTKIGEINVTEALLAKNAQVGGEGNGGVIIPAIHPCRDSYAGMAVLLELLMDKQQPLSQISSTIPDYHLIKNKLPLGDIEPSHLLQTIADQYAGQNINTLDGIHIDFGDAWAQVRASNTEPILRISAEALSPTKAQQLCDDINQLINTHLLYLRAF